MKASPEWYDASLPGLEPDVVLQCIDPRGGTPERSSAPLRRQDWIETAVIQVLAAWALRTDKLATSDSVQLVCRQHGCSGCSRPWWLGARSSERSVTELGALVPN